MKKAFTLIEMLVVIGMITIVAGTTSIISISGNIKKNNDFKRKADLENVRSALENYKSRSATREYPTALSTLGPTPADPKSGQVYYYQASLVNSKYTNYRLCAYMEIPANASGSCAFSCGTPTCNYAVAQP